MSGFKEYSMLFMLNASLGSDYQRTFNKAQAEVAQMQKEIQSLSKIQSDISAYQRQQTAVEASRKKLELLKQQYNNIQQEIQETGTFSSTLQNKLLQKKQQIDKTTEALKKNEATLEKMQNSLDEAGVDTNNLANETERLENEIKEVKSAQEDAAQSADDLGNAYDDIQSAIAALGAVEVLKEIAEWTKECAEASIEYESALTGVYKTVDGTEAQLAEIDREIKELSTDIPVTTTEIAAVAEAAGQLGIATEDVMAFTRVMLDLGESTNLSADEAASRLAKFSNITGTAAENYSRLGSVIVDLGNKYATTEADIVAMSTRLASSGTLVGLSEAEIMALATAMSSVGIETEAGGTAMSQTLATIEKAVSKGGKDVAKFAEIAGMSAKDFSAKWKTSAIETVTAFITGLGELDEQGESATLVLEELGLSGIRQSNMLKSLGLASETLAGAVATANTAWEENTALTIEAEKRYSTTESQLKMLENSYKNMQVAIGDVFTPAIAEGADTLNELLQGVTEFIEDNPEFVAATGSMVVGIGAFAGSVVMLASGMKIATAVTKLFSAALATGFMPVAVIAAVATAIGTYTATVTAATEEELAAEKERDRLIEATKELREAQEQLDEQLDANIGNIEANVYASEALADKLDALIGVENKSVAQKQEMAAVVEQLNSIYPDLNLNYDEEHDVLSDVNGDVLTNTQLIRDNIEALKEQALAQVYMDDYVARLKEEKDARENLDQARAAYDEAERLRTEFVNEHMDGSYTLFDMIELHRLNQGLEEAKNLVGTASQAYGEAQEAVSQAWEEYETIINGFVETTDEAVKELENGEEAFEAGKTTGEEHAKGIESTYPTIQAAIDNAPKFGGFSIPEGMQGQTITAAPKEGFASGTDNATEGWHLVGEEGPEIVYFGGGEKVFTADETKHILQGAQPLSVSEHVQRPVSLNESAIQVETNKETSASGIVLQVSPVFHIDGGVNGMEDRLHEITDLIAENVLEIINEAELNKKRSVYA